MPVTKISASQSRRKSNVGKSDTAELLDDITALILRYVIFASEHVARTIALFILLTYVRNADGTPFFYVSPYLYIRGRGSRHGKSRVIEIMRALVSIPSEHLHRPTEAVLFRLISSEHCTLFIDEIHHMLNGPEASGIITMLNAGNFQDGMTARCDLKDQSSIIKYSVGCPKVLAGKDATESIPEETISRMAIVDMPHEPHASEKLGRRFFIGTYRNEARPIRERCETWISENFKAIHDAPEPRYPDSLTDDRTAEAWTGLFTIAELAGHRWTDYAHAAALYFVPDDDDNAMPESLSFDTAVKTAASRRFVTIAGYEDRNSPPAIAYVAPNGMGPNEFGWPKQKGAFRNVSLRVDEKAGKASLRFNEFEHFWHRVRSANNGHGVSLPDANTILRQLKTDGRLTASGTGNKTPAKIWENEPKKHQIYSIDVSAWIFTDGIITPLTTSTKLYNEMDDKMERILNANTIDGIMEADD
jgi:Protein of unknown function (DUF3631)